MCPQEYLFLIKKISYLTYSATFLSAVEFMDHHLYPPLRTDHKKCLLQCPSSIDPSPTHFPPWPHSVQGCLHSESSDMNHSHGDLMTCTYPSVSTATLLAEPLAVWWTSIKVPTMGNLNFCSMGMCLSIFWILFSQIGFLTFTETGFFSLGFPFHPLISPPGLMPVFVSFSALFQCDFLVKLSSLNNFYVQKTVLFLNANFRHSHTENTHRSHATLLSLVQENLGVTQATHLRERNCRSLLLNGDDKIREEQSAVKMQLILEGETLEDIGVFSWVDVKGFPGHLHDAWERMKMDCDTRWVERTLGS